ncbi:MAG: domain S-box protein [Schlesneria sp.]|nr:domain S-box protein [Schlesneria sp.]
MKIQSLRMRFVLTACLLLVAIVASGTWSVITINRFGATLGDTLDQHQETINVTVQLITCLERQLDSLLLALHGDAQQSAIELRTERQQFDDAYNRLSQRLSSDKDREVFAELRQHEKEFRKASDAFVESADQPGAFGVHYPQINRTLRESVAACRYFRESNVEAMQEEGVEARRAASRSVGVVAGITTAAFLISIVALGHLIRRVMSPIDELDRVVEALRRDDLDSRVQFQSADELGRLADGFNRMAEALKEQRRDAEDRFRQMAENIHEIFWMTDVRIGRVLYVSPGYEEVWGRTCQSLYDLPGSWIDCVHPDDQRAAIEFLEQHQRGVFNDVEFRVVREDSRVRWVRSRAFPIRDQNGDISRVAGLTEDITRRRETQEALRISEQRWRSLTEAMPQLVWTATPDGTCDYFSTQWTQHTGQTESDLLGWGWLETLHPEDRERTRRIWLQAVGGLESYDLEYRVRRHDGEYLWFKTRGLPIRDHDSRIFKWFGTCTDISQLKQAEEGLRRAKDSAESANRSKDEFLANVSHEIRTPMNAILGMTELTLDTPLSDNQRQCLQTVKSAAENLLNIINDLLDFSKIEAGKLELDPTDFSLRTVLGDTLRALAMRAHTKGLELICQIPSDVVDPLIGDAGRLRQILLNLVGNAIKFTDEGEVVVGVAIVDGTLLDSDVELQFTVRDTGIGIPADKQEKIFQAFEQEDTSTTRKYGGTGLGLTIAARLTERMGGTIVVESQPGQGSKFTFSARFLRQPPSTAPEIERTPDSLHNLKVLVVDDSLTNLRILDEWLRGWRMDSTTVSNGNAALEALIDARTQERPFALVLLDSRMPGMDGLALATRLHELDHLSTTRMVLLSSGIIAGDVARARELGIKAHLLKPFQPSELLETIERVMSDSAVRQLTDGAPDTNDPGQQISQTNSASLRVLAAEDNEFNSQVLVQLLARRGYDTQVAKDGRQALTMALSGSFDLMLLDIHMPELDGFQVVSMIRESELSSKKHLPIVAFTARSAKEDRERCLTAGMDDFLPKPIQAANLWEVVDRMIAAYLPRPRPHQLINSATLLATCGGDAALLDRICHAFRNTCPDKLNELRDAMQTRDATQLREVAHKVHGMVATFSTSAGDVASQLEDLAEIGNLNDSIPLAEQLETLVNQLLIQLEGVTIDSLQQAKE